MIKVDQALDLILKSVNILGSEEVKLTDSLGRVLTEDIYAEAQVPLLNNSAMDGYAVRAADVQGAAKDNPKTLEIIESVRAGSLSKKTLSQNQAIKIMTGAPIPDGADCVVKVEDTATNGQNEVKVFESAKPQQHIREGGEDFKQGELVIAKGTLAGAACVGILASLGKPKLKVIRKPKVAILATGDEVIDVEDELQPGKLYSSNSYALYSQVIKAGGIAKNLGIVSDNPKELEAKISQGLDCDFIVTSGGVSMGDYDLVKSVLEKMGTEIKFWKVAIRPGKPVLFGWLKGKPVFGLPGNPVSSMITFEIFVKPAIFKALGRNTDYYKGFEAIVGEELKKKKGFRYFVRAKTVFRDGSYYTGTTGPQGSGILKSMLLANSLMVLPEEAEYIPKGSKVKVIFLH